MQGTILRRQQPKGWPGRKNRPEVPILTHLRPNPFEHTAWPQNEAGKRSIQYWDWLKLEFWRFVFVQKGVAKLAQSALDIRRCGRVRASTSMR